MGFTLQGMPTDITGRRTGGNTGAVPIDVRLGLVIGRAPASDGKGLSFGRLPVSIEDGLSIGQVSVDFNLATRREPDIKHK